MPGICTVLPAVVAAKVVRLCLRPRDAQGGNGWVQASTVNQALAQRAYSKKAPDRRCRGADTAGLDKLFTVQTQRKHTLFLARRKMGNPL